MVTRKTFVPIEVPDDDTVLEDCSAIIVGKKASATGEVLFGHNEDDRGNNVMVQHRVPRGTHKPGEFLVFEPECAKIPQVPETWAYFWSETRASWKASFSDTFINEWGVAIASDSCSGSREDRPELTNGGIGYGIDVYKRQPYGLGSRSSGPFFNVPSCQVKRHYHSSNPGIVCYRQKQRTGAGQACSACPDSYQNIHIGPTVGN